jgi:16S rRNA processing protein RimM
MVRIGKIVATHGIHGSLILSHIVGNSKWLKKGDALMIEVQKGNYIPYFVEQLKANGDDEYHINIEEVTKVEIAKKLITKHVYVDGNILSLLPTDSPLLWIGFNLIDKKVGTVGTIEDVIHTGNQWLAKVMYQDKEALVPLIEQTIEQVSIKNKTVKVTIPDGLLDIYLEA